MLRLTGLLVAPSVNSMMVAMATVGAGAAVLLPISLTLVADMRDTEPVYVPSIYWLCAYRVQNSGSTAF
ncbi:MAG: hypothetical protein QF515_06350 [Pseudomonadales bacterium]|nr:hypothetical protein [Pseudomonadales bacterium]